MEGRDFFLWQTFFLMRVGPPLGVASAGASPGPTRPHVMFGCGHWRALRYQIRSPLPQLGRGLGVIRPRPGSEGQRSEGEVSSGNSWLSTFNFRLFASLTLDFARSSKNAGGAAGFWKCQDLRYRSMMFSVV